MIPLPSLWNCPPTTGPLWATCCAACGSAAGPSSRRPVPSSCCPPSSCGSLLTSAGSTASSRCCLRSRSTAPSWPRSATPSPGSSRLWAGATGRLPWPPSPVWWQRRTSSVRWAFCTAAAKALSMTPSVLPSPVSAATPSWCSTCCALLASRPSVLSSVR